MTRTIQETIDELHSSLKDYIEATYHIGDAALIKHGNVGKKARTQQTAIIDAQFTGVQRGDFADSFFQRDYFFITYVF